MHLGNGAVTPECGLVAFGAAAVGVGVAWRKLRTEAIERERTWLVAGLATAVFAAQMFNVQVSTFSSAHLLGGVLLAWVAGPALGLLSMAAILLLQAVLLGDGGLASLGANVINMALWPAAVVALARRWLPLGSCASTAVVVGVISLVSVIGAAGLVVLEVAIGRSSSELSGLGVFAVQLLGAHVVIGLFESVATVAAVAALGALATRSAPTSPARIRAALLFGLGLVVVALSLPGVGFSSSVPDGYEAALNSAEAAGSPLGSIETTSSLTGIAATIDRWQTALAAPLSSLSAVLPMLAALVAGGFAWVCARFAGPSAG